MQSPLNYSFKPALLVAEQQVELTDEHLSCSTAKGTKFSIRYKDIVALRFVDHSLANNKFRRLDMVTGNGQTHSFSITSDRQSEPDTNPDLRAFWGVCRALLERIAANNPQLPVTVGEAPKYKHLLFAFGVLALLLAGGIIAGILVSGDGWLKVIEAVIPTLLLAALGFLLCKANHPWVKAPTASATDLAAFIASKTSS